MDESQLKGVAVGKRAVITLRSSPGEQWAGQVVRLGHQSDRVTEELQVDVAFSPPLKNFRLGEQSEVYITTEFKRSVFAISSAALVISGKKSGVWVADNDRLKFREVVIGIKDRSDFAEITGGLAGSLSMAQLSPMKVGKAELT